MRHETARRDAWIALSPAMLLLVALTVLPLLYVVWLSLQHRSVIHPQSFAGLQHYVRILGDMRFWSALGTTLYFALVSVAAELVLGLICALFLLRVGKGRAWIYAMLLVPWAVPTVVSARMWEWMYNVETGVINHLLGLRINWLGDPFWALNAAIVMDVWKSTPFVTLLLLAGLQGVPRDLYRAASVDGASPWTQFRRVTLPMVTPVLLVILVFRTIDALRVFDSLYVLTGGGPANRTESLSIYAYKTLFHSLDFGYGATIAVTMLLLTGGITLLYAKLLGEEAP